jgi:hypothetical protein
MLARFNMDLCEGIQIPYRHRLSLSSKECPKTQEEKDRMSRIPNALSYGKSYVRYVMY